MIVHLSMLSISTSHHGSLSILLL